MTSPSTPSSGAPPVIVGVYDGLWWFEVVCDGLW